MVVKFLTVFAVLTALVLLASYLVYQIIFSNNKRFMRDDDRFVPCSMSKDCYDGCGSDKSFVVIESAGHGLCYCVNSEKYEHAVDSFLQKIVGPAR